MAILVYPSLLLASVKGTDCTLIVTDFAAGVKGQPPHLAAAPRAAWR